MINLKGKPFYLNDDDIKWIETVKSKLTIKEKISQLFCLIAYSAEEDYLKHLANDLKIGGIMCRVMSVEEMCKTVEVLQKNSNIPFLISANLETGGAGVCLTGTKLGSEMSIAACNNKNMAKRLGEVCGKEGSVLGVNWAFAPIVDIDYNFRNPITNTRTFGSNKEIVKEFGLEYIKEIQKYGIAACAKHFPGDGVDERDQHLVTSINSLSCEEWDNSYGSIYKTVIDAGVKTVMVGHIMLPSYSKKYNDKIKDEEILPATLSYEIVTKLLKEKLGFNGLVITDSTTMAGLNIAMPRRDLVPLTIASGCDMFLFTKNLEEDFKYMYEGYQKGIITEERLNEAVTKILALKASLDLHRKNNLPDYQNIDKIIGCEEFKKLAKEVADNSITLVKNKENILPITPKKYKRILFYSLESSAGNMGFSVAVGANNKLMEKLKKAGFEVTLFTPKSGFEGTMISAEEIQNSYDLIIYSANLATKSNQTIVRIEWCEPMGANVPIYMTSIPTIFISLENPYHLLDAPRVKTYINTYCSSDIVLDSLVDKLLGKSEFKGVSPVDAFCGKWDTRL